MAQVKGKFIKMVAYFMLSNELQAANQYLQGQLGITHAELVDEDWYEVSIFDEFMKTCEQKSVFKDQIYVNIGKRVYPTIKRTIGLPEELDGPQSFILYEADGFLQNHKGDDVVPRRIIRSSPREVVIEAKAPGYNGKLYEGVWLGILEMCGVGTGQVDQLGGDVYRITW